MLKEIQITNFAIIENLEITFDKGFNVFTGETGAGKSIILDAVSAVLGGKVDQTFVREGSERASVEAVFDYGLHKAEIVEILEAEDLLPDDDIDEIVLSREIRSGGRSSSRINGHSTSAAIQQRIGEYLVDIHGQSEHLSLLRPGSHIHLLDQFAGNQDLLKQYRKVWKELSAVRKEIRSLQIDEEEALRRKDILQFQINEINAATLSEEEETDLLKERDKLANAESLEANCLKCLECFEGGQDDNSGILDKLGVLEKAVSNLQRVDNDIQPLTDMTSSAFDQINEAYYFIQKYHDSLDFDPQRQEHIEERLMLYSTLKRKYGGSVPAVLAFGAQSEEKLASLENVEARTEDLEIREKDLIQHVSGLAGQLSERRLHTAETLSRGIEKELDDLRMPEAGFRIMITAVPDENGIKLEDGRTFAFDENGFDKVEFLIAPNPGEGYKPLARIASGGETSRLMLAVKNTLAKADTISTMIFDEIDQGIGGRVGAVVGEKLWELSRSHQVLCITHLPQLAAFFDRHFHVYKVIDEGRTHTIVSELSPEKSLEESAALLGSISQENITATKKMREESVAIKQRQ